MVKLSPNESKLTERVGAIKGHESMSEDELLGTLISSKPVIKSENPKINFSKPRIEKIRKEFNESRHKFSKSKINEIRRNLYEIENEKNLFYDIEYKGIRDVKDLFDLSIDEDYHKPINSNQWCF